MLLISTTLPSVLAFSDHNTNISGLVVRKELKLDNYSWRKHDEGEECLKKWLEIDTWMQYKKKIVYVVPKCYWMLV